MQVEVLHPLHDLDVKDNKEGCRTFEGGVNRDNPLWDSANDEDDYSHGDGAHDASGPREATRKPLPGCANANSSSHANR